MDTHTERCPRCGKPTRGVSSHGEPPATLKCLVFDRIDPLQSRQIEGWTKSDALKPPENYSCLFSIGAGK